MAYLNPWHLVSANPGIDITWLIQPCKVRLPVIWNYMLMIICKISKQMKVRLLMSDKRNIQLQKESNANKKKTEKKVEVPHHFWGLMSKEKLFWRETSDVRKKEKGKDKETYLLTNIIWCCDLGILNPSWFHPQRKGTLCKVRTRKISSQTRQTYASLESTVLCFHHVDTLWDDDVPDSIAVAISVYLRGSKTSSLALMPASW